MLVLLSPSGEFLLISTLRLETAAWAGFRSAVHMTKLKSRLLRLGFKEMGKL